MRFPGLQPYANRHGGSGVTAWVRHGDLLVVEFGHGPVYVYAARAVGRPLFTALCDAALAGHGLSTLISREVGDRYAARFDDREDWSRTLAGRRSRAAH
ncbi:hypothetical protein [Luteimonas deserti]|uniref:KTSC domain-containing protein n=1 Tax=Luteimonas deserti TaxID=2752306 RepID=A0A7Z0QM79_9GAMM|nr:hypothetical protein [Luteimonas deserti]NYZ61227.1 hypothetical protein [Luteimonas deserti]